MPINPQKMIMIPLTRKRQLEGFKSPVPKSERIPLTADTKYRLALANVKSLQKLVCLLIAGAFRLTPTAAVGVLDFPTQIIYLKSIY